MYEKPLSLLLMKLVLACCWWGLILSTCLFLIVFVVMSNDDMEFAVLGYASDIEISEIAATDRQGQPLDFEFDGPARVRFSIPYLPGEAHSPFLRKLVAVAMTLPLFVLGLYFVKQLRDVVRTIDDGDPFDESNAKRVRVIGILIFVFELIRCLGQFGMSGYADTLVVPQGFNLNGRIDFNGSMLLVSLAVIVLSEVFRHGARMRHEQSLTI